MKNFKPELGQACFGQPSKEFAVPAIWEAALNHVKWRLGILQWNKTQKKYPSPFDNTGNDFKCDVFEVAAYDWSEETQPYNFKWRDAEISWYKYVGRGMGSNKEITPDMASEMLEECLKALDKLEESHGGFQESQSK